MKCESVTIKLLLRCSFLLTFSIMFLLSLSCKKSNPITESEDTENFPPGRRDYQWTVDTIRIQFAQLNFLWGSSPTDEWGVTDGGGSNTTIWHYDGIKWQTDRIPRAIFPWCIYGFSNDDIWIAGDDGNIWHFDAAGWQSNFAFTKPGWRVTFLDIWGETPENLWVCGDADSGNIRKGILLKKENNGWIEKPIQADSIAFITIRRGLKSSGSYFLVGVKEPSTGGTNCVLLSHDGETKTQFIYEAPFTKEQWTSVAEYNKKLYFTFGSTIQKYRGGRFIKFLDITEPNFFPKIFIRHENDIFLSMSDGIAHFNGNDVQYIYRFSGKKYINSISIFEKDIFILLNDFDEFTSLIIHGKLIDK